MGDRHEEDHNNACNAGSLLGATLFYVTPVSIRSLPVGTASVSIDKAEARIERPLTLMGDAGVTRRMHRRA
jgi:hypothetical protein